MRSKVCRRGRAFCEAVKFPTAAEISSSAFKVQVVDTFSKISLSCNVFEDRRQSSLVVPQSSHLNEFTATSRQNSSQQRDRGWLRCLKALGAYQPPCVVQRHAQIDEFSAAALFLADGNDPVPWQWGFNLEIRSGTGMKRFSSPSRCLQTIVELLSALSFFTKFKKIGVSAHTRHYMTPRKWLAVHDMTSAHVPRAGVKRVAQERFVRIKCSHIISAGFSRARCGQGPMNNRLALQDWSSPPAQGHWHDHRDFRARE